MKKNRFLVAGFSCILAYLLFVKVELFGFYDWEQLSFYINAGGFLDIVLGTAGCVLIGLYLHGKPWLEKTEKVIQCVGVITTLIYFISLNTNAPSTAWPVFSVAITPLLYAYMLRLIWLLLYKIERDN